MRGRAQHDAQARAFRARGEVARADLERFAIEFEQHAGITTAREQQRNAEQQRESRRVLPSKCVSHVLPPPQKTILLQL